MVPRQGTAALRQRSRWLPPHGGARRMLAWLALILVTLSAEHLAATDSTAILAALRAGDRPQLELAYAKACRAADEGHYEGYRLKTYCAGLLWHIGADTVTLETTAVAAREWLGRCQHQSQSMEATGYLAHIYIEQGRPEEALSLWMTAAQHHGEGAINADALYWMGRLACATETHRAGGRACLERFCSLYPTHRLAGEALLLLYPLEQYLDGDQAALKNLQQLTERHPQTTPAAVAHYLLAINRWRRALQGHGFLTRTPRLLRQAGRSFLTACVLAGAERAKSAKDDNASAEPLLWLQGQALLGRGMALERLMQHPAVLHKHDLLREGLANAQDLCSLMEEAATLPPTPQLSALQRRTLCHMTTMRCHQGEWPEAEDAALKAIALCQGEQSSSAVHDCLAALQPLIKGFINDGQYAAAHRWLERCEGLLSSAEDDEQTLDLLLLRAQCYRQQGDEHEAMLTLSRIINSPVASSRRIEAMLMRADIYLQQDRREQAIKQLEAVKARGGSWSVHAEKEIQRLRS